MSDTPERSQSATKRKTRGKTSAVASGRQGPPIGTVTPKLDDETAAALTLYNTYLVADRSQQAHERALKKAEKAKDDAAAAVRKLNDRKAPASEVASAEAAYREAAEALRRLRGGETAVAEDSEEEAGDDTAAAADQDAAAEVAEPPAEAHAEPEHADPAAHAEPEHADAAATEETAQPDEPDSTGSDDEPDSTTSDPEPASVGVEASVDDDDLAGDEPSGVTGEQ